MNISEVISCQHTVRCLKRAGIHTVEELKELSLTDLLQIKGIGPVIAWDILAELSDKTKTKE